MVFVLHQATVAAVLGLTWQEWKTSPFVTSLVFFRKELQFLQKAALVQRKSGLALSQEVKLWIVKWRGLVAAGCRRTADFFRSGAMSVFFLSSRFMSSGRSGTVLLFPSHRRNAVVP